MSCENTVKVSPRLVPHFFGLPQHVASWRASSIPRRSARLVQAPCATCRAQLQQQEAQVDREVRIAPGELFGHPLTAASRLRPASTGGHQEVEQIGEAVAVFPLALDAPHLEHLVGAEDCRAGQQAGHGDAAHAALAAGDQRHEHDHAERRDGQRHGPARPDR